MSRLLLVIGGALCLALSSLVREDPPAGGGPLAAVGRSLGGWRVLAVDVLALRAEALRRQGRSEEVPPLYEAMVELDPGNASATEALADEIVREVLPAAATLAERVERWREAWDLIARGLHVHPGSALLAWRGAELLLVVAEQEPGLESAVDALFQGRERREVVGLGLLLAAARAEEHLPRSGRTHLITLARESPRLAARALARGAAVAEVEARLAPAEELLRLHPAVTAEIVLLAEPTPTEPEGRSLPVRELVERSAALVRAALRAREAGAPGQLAGPLAEFELFCGRTPTSAMLLAWSRGN